MSGQRTLDSIGLNVPFNHDPRTLDALVYINANPTTRFPMRQIYFSELYDADCRILDAYERKEGSKAKLAAWFSVSFDDVHKILRHLRRREKNNVNPNRDMAGSAALPRRKERRLHNRQPNAGDTFAKVGCKVGFSRWSGLGPTQSCLLS